MPISLTGSTQISASGNVIAGGFMSAAGNITAAGNISVGNLTITTASSATSYSATGNITAANVVVTGTAAAGSAVLLVSGNIQTTAANNTANIGNASNYFNTVHAKATTAQYADLAECYVSDTTYSPGTVVSFGGSHEITVSTTPGDQRVAGVVSTQPAYIMNNGCAGDYRTEVALVGKVPTRVTGQVHKGDMMISAGDGRACACSEPKLGSVIGKSLEDFLGQDGIINVVVGRL